MNFDNPTQIVLGMKGTFGGKTYRVAGRVVLGVVQSGVTYYWNEYNLVTETGESATLVFEETERGAEWRVFTLFEPQQAYSAETAATKRWGDLVNVEGTDYHITRVDRSRIYHIEGIAPEGEKTGSVAHYFNALSCGKLLVVSWTGSEVEYYRGMNVSSGMVASAFNLSGMNLVKFKASAGWSYAKAQSVMTAALLIFIGVLVFSVLLNWSRPRTVPATPSYAAPAAQLRPGDQLTLGGTKFRVASQALTQCDEMDAHAQWREYQLLDDAGGEALLIEGLAPGHADWSLFIPIQPAEPMTPLQAGAVQSGRVVTVDQTAAMVSVLFRDKILQTDAAPATGTQAGDITFGFLAKKDETLLLARWNASRITFHLGRTITPAEFKAARPGTGGK